MTDPLCLALRNIRTGRGLTLRAVGHAIGLRASHICNYEKGRVAPALPTLRAWAYLLGHDLTLNPIHRSDPHDSLPHTPLPDV